MWRGVWDSDFWIILILSTFGSMYPRGSVLSERRRPSSCSESNAENNNENISQIRRFCAVTAVCQWILCSNTTIIHSSAPNSHPNTKARACAAAQVKFRQKARHRAITKLHCDRTACSHKPITPTHTQNSITLSRLADAERDGY